MYALDGRFKELVQEVTARKVCYYPKYFVLLMCARVLRQTIIMELYRLFQQCFMEILGV